MIYAVIKTITLMAKVDQQEQAKTSKLVHELYILPAQQSGDHEWDYMMYCDCTTDQLRFQTHQHRCGLAVLTGTASD